MITHTKKQTITLALSLLLPTLALQSMQLSNPHKKIMEKNYRSKEKNINGTIQLNDGFVHINQTDIFLETPVSILEHITHFPITYATENNTNIPAQHNEPFVCAKIIDKKTNKQIQFKNGNTINIPLKTFHNATDGSKIFFKTIKGTKYNFSLICAKNPNIKGNDFKEQLDTCTKLFYKHAPVNNRNDIDTLINSNIITSGVTFVAGITTFGSVLLHEQTNQHSTNSCSSEEVFVQQIINSSSLKSDLNAPTNIYTSLKGREYGNTKLFKQ